MSLCCEFVSRVDHITVNNIIEINFRKSLLSYRYFKHKPLMQINLSVKTKDYFSYFHKQLFSSEPGAKPPHHYDSDRTAAAGIHYKSLKLKVKLKC